MDESEFKAEFGARVRHWRDRRKMSQEELAHVAGMNRSYMSDVECGRRCIGLLYAAKIADALKVKLYKLMPDWPMK